MSAVCRNGLVGLTGLLLEPWFGWISSLPPFTSLPLAVNLREVESVGQWTQGLLDPYFAVIFTTEGREMPLPWPEAPQCSSCCVSLVYFCQLESRRGLVRRFGSSLRLRCLRWGHSF